MAHHSASHDSTTTTARHSSFNTTHHNTSHLSVRVTCSACCTPAGILLALPDTYTHAPPFSSAHSAAPCSLMRSVTYTLVVLVLVPALLSAAPDTGCVADSCAAGADDDAGGGGAVGCREKAVMRPTGAGASTPACSNNAHMTTAHAGSRAYALRLWLVLYTITVHGTLQAVSKAPTCGALERRCVRVSHTPTHYTYHTTARITAPYLLVCLPLLPVVEVCIRAAASKHQHAGPRHLLLLLLLHHCIALLQEGSERSNTYSTTYPVTPPVRLFVTQPTS